MTLARRRSVLSRLLEEPVLDVTARDVFSARGHQVRERHTAHQGELSAWQHLVAMFFVAIRNYSHSICFART